MTIAERLLVSLAREREDAILVVEATDPKWDIPTVRQALEGTKPLSILEVPR